MFSFRVFCLFGSFGDFAGSGVRSLVRVSRIELGSVRGVFRFRSCVVYFRRSCSRRLCRRRSCRRRFRRSFRSRC